MKKQIDSGWFFLNADLVCGKTSGNFESLEARRTSVVQMPLEKLHICPAWIRW
jgi:hypothetical protein